MTITEGFIIRRLIGRLGKEHLLQSVCSYDTSGSDDVVNDYDIGGDDDINNDDGDDNGC